LGHRVVAAEEQLAIATDRVAEVFELEPIRVDELDLDPLDLPRAAELDARHPAVPRIIKKERALAADGLELVALRHRRAAVEQGHHVTREAEHAGEDPISPRRPEPRLAVGLLGLAAEEA